MTGNDTNEVLSADPEQAEPASTIVWKESIKSWDIDWGMIKYEFVNWEVPWRLYGWKTFLKCSFIALVMLALSSFDLGIDAQLASFYIHNQSYTYFFTNQSDPFINQFNCEYLNKTPGVNMNDNAITP